jgi:hypothetical protein
MRIPDHLSDAEAREKLIKYLIKNPIKRGKPGCYQKVAEEFNVRSEYVRRIYRTLREKGLVPDDPVTSSSDSSFKEDVKSGNADVNFVTTKRVKTLADLIKVCEIDEKEWEIVSWECTKWEVGRKDKKVEWHVKRGEVKKGAISDSGKIFVEPLYRVKAKLVRRKIESDLGLQKDLILEEIKNFKPVDAFELLNKYSTILSAQGDDEKEYLLELSLPDPHFGKLAWRAETDDDYDLKIAETRFKKAIQNLLLRANLNTVGRILFPIGNDLINVDNRHNTTFAGTPQDTDCRFMKIIGIVKRILIEVITELSVIAPVDVVIVPGNHDTSTCFMIGEILDAFFHGNDRVNIDNVPKLRKYYKFGKTGIQLTHGNEEKHESLGLIFATEQPKLWYETKYRFCQLGHLHKNKKMVHTSVDEFQGFQVQIIPSLSGTDFWHKSKGYNTLKQAKMFLYHPNEGLIGEFTTTAS